MHLKTTLPPPHPKEAHGGRREVDDPWINNRVVRAFQVVNIWVHKMFLVLTNYFEPALIL